MKRISLFLTVFIFLGTTQVVSAQFANGDTCFRADQCTSGYCKCPFNGCNQDPGSGTIRSGQCQVDPNGAPPEEVPKGPPGSTCDSNLQCESGNCDIRNRSCLGTNPPAEPGNPITYPSCRSDAATTGTSSLPGVEPCMNASNAVRYQCQTGKLLDVSRGGCVDPNTTAPIDPESGTMVDSLFLWQVNPLTITGNSIPGLQFLEGIINVWRFGTPGQFLSQLLPLLFSIAGLIMFFMFVWGGFEMIYRQDDPKVFEVGKNRITAAVIGFFLLFTSYWIAQLVELAFGVSFLG